MMLLKSLLQVLILGTFTFLLTNTILKAQVSPGDPGNFITTWKTDNPGASDNNQITIPTTGSGYNYDVYWENLNNSSQNGSVNDNNGNLTITFPTSGTYRIEISGEFPQIFFADDIDNEKILTIEQWGDIQWRSMNRAFEGALNLTYNATDAPNLSSVSAINRMFVNAKSFNGDLSNWDVSKVTDMNRMFYGATSFNQDLNSWNVGQVGSMSEMFREATSFNGDISSWNVSRVIDMEFMFVDASNFNQPLNDWDVSNLTTMERMFQGASSFNKDLNNWDVSNVTNMERMFEFAGNFNGEISDWNVSSVNNMSFMFRDARKFNKDLNNWDVSKVTNMVGMFSDARNFNGNVEGWDVSNVTNMNNLFRWAEVFTGNLSNWDVSNVTNMSGMFTSAKAFNGDLSNWDVSSVTTLASMFLGASKFNGDLSKWDVGNVTSIFQIFANAISFNGDLSNWDVSKVTNMRGAFLRATSFDKDVSNWDVSSANNMNDLFANATLFNNDLSNWDVTNVATMDNMLDYSGLSTENYDATLIGWAALNLQKNVTLGADGLVYCNAKTERNTLIENFSWTITDDTFYCPGVFPFAPDNNNILYVDQSVTSSDGSGSSWDNAISELRDALNWAENGWEDSLEPLQIWVATGTYFPTNDESDRSASFRMVDAVELYGGFIGSETSLMDRNLADNRTILSGDIDQNDNSIDGLVAQSKDIVGNNSFSVVRSIGNKSTAVLDGFTITAGNAVGSSITNSLLTVYGGGMYIGSNSTPALTNLSFIGNHAFAGGGMGSFNSNPTLTNAIFTGNSADRYCGALLNGNSGATLTNISFTENSAGDDGGAICDNPSQIDAPNLTLTNVIIWNNEANGNTNTSSASFFNFSDANSKFAHSLVANSGGSGTDWSEAIGIDGGDNIDEDPLFVDPLNRDYKLSENSPVINMGDPNTDLSLFSGGPGNPLDLAGNSRVFGGESGIIDMGAYEFQGVETNSIQLSGSEGWRFMASPSEGDSYRDLFSDITVDLDFPVRQTLFELDQPNYEWDPVGSLNDEPGVGTPFIVYVEKVDLPFTVTSGTNFIPSDGSFTYSGLDFSDQAPNPDSFFLLGNPHPFAMDFCEFSSNNIATSVSFWDPAANAGNGDYISLSCAIDEQVPIAPFQAFWVRTTEANPSLGIPDAAYLGTEESGYFKDAENETATSSDESAPVITLKVNGPDEGFTTATQILFTSGALSGLDEDDAPKLSSIGLASRWLSLYSVDQQDRTYAIQALPKPAAKSVRIPLAVETTESGVFVLEWSLPESKLFNAGFFLRDNTTGHVIELLDGNSHSFIVEENQIEKTIATENSKSIDPGTTLQAETSPNPRFELLITSSGMDGFTELGDLPKSFTLKQNYPNPFNPTTVISYELPQSADVRLEVYDIAGRQVATLVNGQVAAGRHRVNFNASNLSSGVYLYRLEAGSQVMTKKLTILK
jgi:surface protein/predicted outer membrane repeat protein